MREQLESLTAHCEGRIRLITVGHGHTTGPNVYVLSPLDEQAMGRVVRAAEPGLTPDQVQWVVNRTQGFVKLAVVVTKALSRGAATVGDMSSDRQIANVVSRMISGNDLPQQALRALSLLTRVGWSGTPSVEGQAIAEFMGMTWNQLQTAALPAFDQGVLVKKGEYVYVTPQLLAEWLAADVWRNQSQRIGELHDLVPTAAGKDSMLKRLGQLAGVSGVVDVLQEFFAINGPFPDLESVSQGRSAAIFRALAEGAPEMAIDALVRILGGQTRERLLEFGDGRREIVWTLERLLFSRSTFFASARLIRRLAEAENESFGNNATGVWSAIFLTRLAPTEVPASERLSLVNEALSSSDALSKELGIKAISSALQGPEMGLAINERASSPLTRWQPHTWGEIWEYKREALRLLQLASEDEVPAVRKSARQTFLTQCRALASVGLAPEVVDGFGRIAPEDDSERREVWESCMQVLRFERETLDESQRDALTQIASSIYGESLDDRIRRYVGRFSSVDWPRPDEHEIPRPEEIASSLADEAMTTNADLSRILPWLASGEAEGVWPFAVRLGQVDSTRRWFEQIERACTTAPDPRLASGYLRGQADMGNSVWSSAVIERWAQAQSTAALSFDATLRSPGNDLGVDRIVALIHRNWIDPSMLAWLRFGGWPSGISAAGLKRLTELLDDTEPQAVETGITILWHWLEAPDHRSNRTVRALASRFLRAAAKYGGGGTMTSYYWTLVAKRAFPQEPRKVAQLILLGLQSGNVHMGDERVGLLTELIETAPSEVWPEVAKSLRRTDSHWLAWMLQDSGAVLRVPVDMVTDTLARSGPNNAMAVARAVKPSDTGLSPLVAYLIRYHPETRTEIIGNYLSGVWSGSEEAYLRRKLDGIQTWQSHPSLDADTNAWISDVITSFEADIRRARVQEENEELR